MSDKVGSDDDSSNSDVAITLGVLNAVDRGEPITQRSLANELGVALGLANAYLKRADQKGWIKIQQVPPNRYAYYLTPQGFSEKARLTAEYLSGSLNFFRHAKTQINEVLDRFAACGRRRIVLIGISELAEIATLCGLQSDAELLGIVDPNSSKDSFAGLPVARRLEDLPAAEAYIITVFRDAQGLYDGMVARYGSERVAAPRLLNLRMKEAGGAAGANADDGRPEDRA
jgi:DNA-binding MarR family transcriptional regulator